MSPRARILFVALMLLVAVTCVRLGLWQRSRLLARRARNAAAQAARQLPELALGSGTGVLADRRVVAHGRFDPEHQVLLRGQVLNGSPGVVIVTPLLGAAGDSAVLVVRGFVPSADGVTVSGLDSLREPGARSVAGIVRPLDDRAGRGQPLTRNGQTSWRELELGALRRELPYPILAFAIFEPSEPGQTSLPRRLGLPPLDDGPHLSYMLQWFAFALIAVVMALLALRRHRASGWSEPTAAAPSAGVPPPAPPP